MVDIIARLKIRAEEFSRGTKAAFGGLEEEAAQSGDRAGEAFAGNLSRRLDGLLTGAGIAAIAALGQRALDHVSALKKESQQLGVTTDALQEYQYAARELGVEQDVLTDSFGGLTQKIGEARAGNKGASQAFKDIGVDIESATGSSKSMTTVLDELIGRLSSVQDPTERARLEAQLFGDQWQKIDPLLRAGSERMDGLRAAAHNLGVVISSDAIQNADEAARKLEQVKAVLEARIAGIVAENAGAIIGLANALGFAAEKAAWFFNTMRGVEKLKRDEGWLSGFFSGPSRQLVAADPVKYLQSRTSDLQAASAARQRLEGGNNTTRAGVQQLRIARAREQEALRLMRAAQDDVRPLQAQAAASTKWRVNVPWASGDSIDKLSQGAAAKAGGSGASGKGSSGPSDAERTARQQEEAAQRLSDSLDDVIARQRESEQIAQMRARHQDREADIQEALLDIERQFPALEGTTNAEAAKQLKIREDQVEVERQKYELAKKNAAEAAGRKFDDRALKDRIDAEEKAQEELARQREAAMERERRSIEDLSRLYYDLFSGHAGDIWKDFKREGMEVISVLAAQWTIAMVTGQKFDPATALGGASGIGFGGPASTLFGALFSGRGKGLAEAAASEGGSAEQIAAAAGLQKNLGETSKQLGGLNKYLAGVGAGQAVSGLAGAIGVKQSSTAALAGSVIGTAIGGPLGGAIGGLVAGTIGGLLKKTKKGSASINIADGEAAVGDAYGNSASYRRNATALGGGVADQLNSIADALGVDLTGNASVSIGQRKKKFVVDTSGQRRTKGAGTMSFDTEEAAIEAAVRDALKDGVLGRVSDASRRLLLSGQDLGKALQKAVLIESIPKQLQARLDPVGYAIDELNDKWDKTIDALREGGATAEQMAQAQQLYNLELEDVKTNTAGAAKSLKDFMGALNAGSASPLSLRDQEAAAQAALSPYLDKISQGSSIDQEAYQAAAQSFLDIERQLYGSTSKYFEAFDAIQSATSTAIGTIDNATPIRTSSDPFNETTATATQATAANTSNIAALLAQSNALLAQLAANGLGGASFIGTNRSFAV